MLIQFPTRITAMFDGLAKIVDKFDIELIISYGSTITGLKKGVSNKTDTDLIIVSDFFMSMSRAKRVDLVLKEISGNFDPIIITKKEYLGLKGREESIVNVALSEGLILYAKRRNGSGA